MFIDIYNILYTVFDNIIVQKYVSDSISSLLKKYNADDSKLLYIGLGKHGSVYITGIKDCNKVLYIPNNMLHYSSIGNILRKSSIIGLFMNSNYESSLNNNGGEYLYEYERESLLYGRWFDIYQRLSGNYDATNIYKFFNTHHSVALGESNISVKLDFIHRFMDDNKDFASLLLSKITEEVMSRYMNKYCGSISLVGETVKSDIDLHILEEISNMNANYIDTILSPFSKFIEKTLMDDVLNNIKNEHNKDVIMSDMRESNLLLSMRCIRYTLVSSNPFIRIPFIYSNSNMDMDDIFKSNRDIIHIIMINMYNDIFPGDNLVLLDDLISIILNMIDDTYISYIYDSVHNDYMKNTLIDIFIIGFISRYYLLALNILNYVILTDLSKINHPKYEIEVDDPSEYSGIFNFNTLIDVNGTDGKRYIKFDTEDIIDSDIFFINNEGGNINE